MEASSGVDGAAKMWEESLARVVPAIVVIRVCSVGAYDGDGAGYSKATGFVVDKARGIILTNRHVVSPGAQSKTALVTPYVVRKDESKTQSGYLRSFLRCHLWHELKSLQNFIIFKFPTSCNRRRHLLHLLLCVSV